ncbi:MAG: hypothetical protein ACREXY_13085 [Gammaproteobacteria bacterium]
MWTHYTTVSMLRTIEEVLGIKPLGINDGLTAPMADLFNKRQRSWDYQAVVPQILYTTQLELPPQDQAEVAATRMPCHGAPTRDGIYWAAAMRGQDFSVEDRLDVAAFNRALWTGLQGAKVPYPTWRDGRDLRENRAALLKKHALRVKAQCTSQVAEVE